MARGKPRRSLLGPGDRVQGVFRAAAQALQLLKEARDVRLVGKAAETEQRRPYKCSLCGSPTDPKLAQCPECDAVFDSHEAKLKAT